MNITDLKTLTAKALKNAFDLDYDIDEISWELPPNKDFGDLSSPLSLKLARVLRRRPLDIANDLGEALKPLLPETIESINITAPGYINLHYNYLHIIEGLLAAPYSIDAEKDSKGKIVIEHTNINPNKAAHIGHLRNACLGDTLARLLRSTGYRLEVQNYIDDTGTAVADIVVGMELLNPVWDQEKETYDYFCWDLYTEINDRYLVEPELKEKQREVLHDIERGGNPRATLAKEISTKIVNCHLATMARFGIFYDLLTWESDILHLGFWTHAFNHLKDNDGMAFETEGPNAGCWVIKLDDVEGFSHLENPDKVLVRSNGTATYVAKDIAYQMWKFGILGLDFQYRPYITQENGQVLETTDTSHGEESDLYGQSDKVINVIDIRQKYLQDVLRLSLDKLGYSQEAKNSIHFDYEVVALSATAAKELVVSVDEEDEKGIYAMAGRRGIGVKADDLVNMAIERATLEVAKRHPEHSNEENVKLGTQIAIGAIRYYMIRYNMNSLIVFDFNDALNMQGNTGPYLQYAHARANNILQRAKDQNIKANPSLPADLELTGPEKDLIRRIYELPEAVVNAAEALAPSQLTDYVYQLAASFMRFYETTQVLNAPREDIRAFRLSLVELYKTALKDALTVLGIPAPNRM